MFWRRNDHVQSKLSVSFISTIITELLAMQKLSFSPVNVSGSGVQKVFYDGNTFFSCKMALLFSTVLKIVLLDNLDF